MKRLLNILTAERSRTYPSPQRTCRFSLILGFALYCCVSGLEFFNQTLLAKDEYPGVEFDFQSRSTGMVQAGTTKEGLSESSNLLCITVPLAGSDQLGVASDFTFEHSSFDFKMPTGYATVPAPLLSSANSLLCQPTFQCRLGSSWRVFASPSFGYSWAAHAGLKDASLWSVSVGGLFLKDQDFQVGLGVEVSQRMKASNRVWPFPLFQWNIDARWTLNSTDGQSGRLTYAVTPRFSFAGQMEYRSQDIRLAKSSSVPAGILRLETLSLCLGGIYKPRPHTIVALLVGKAPYQSYRIEDVNGNPVAPSFSGCPWTVFMELDCTF